MSTGDLLERATRATRERTDGAASDAGRTRARVMASAAKSGKRRRLVTLLLPIAAVLAVSTAWAGQHGLLAAAWQRIETSFAPSAPPPSPEVAVRAASAPARAPDPTPAPTVAEVPIVSVDSLPRADEPTPTPGPISTSTSTSTSTPTPGSLSASRPEPGVPPGNAAATLYAAAHRAHFVDHDPSTALRAWDAYLLAAPDGPLAPEARYNRAITLVRLGRSDDARRALTPFANGAYGTYRAREARELLDALPADE